MSSSWEAPGEPKPKALEVAALLTELGVTHVVSIPDNQSAPLLDAIRARSEIPVLFGTREGEVISLASGLWAGGASPLVIIQNTGLLESGDALRGTASRMGVPLLLLVTCRGFERSRAMGWEPGELEVDRDVLVRSDLDSVAPMTGPTLQAWGIPYLFLRDREDLSAIREGWEIASREERPVAVLIDILFS